LPDILVQIIKKHFVCRFVAVHVSQEVKCYSLVVQSHNIHVKIVTEFPQNTRKIHVEIGGNNFNKTLLLSLSLFPVAPTLEHRLSVKRFVSLQFLNPKTVGRTPWKGDQPVARLNIHRSTGT
jgi:hypothetical protein